MLRFFNTLSGKQEEFKPLVDNSVRMYACGPTVYDYAHIGNFRTFVFVDLLRRYLKYKGYNVIHVMNITDVDDRTIQRSQAEGIELSQYTRKYTEEFLKDFHTLNIQHPEIIPRATDHIPEMVELVKRLEARGFTYASAGSVYYRISSFPDYGKLSKINLEGNVAGARVDVDSYDKADARDFVLWKARRDDEPAWDTELGVGRPGWHLECSAMSMKYLGESFDIHCGGVDLIFPHHENEIAQSEGATAKEFVRFWLHAEHLMVEGEKMSKSLGNYYTLRDILEKGYSPSAIRYLLLSVPYRQQLNFTFEGLRAAQASLERLKNFKRRLKESALEEGYNESIAEATGRAREKFESSLDDDLNTSVALAAIFELLREVNAALDSEQVKSRNRAELLELLDRFDTVLGVIGEEREEMLDSEIAALIEERHQARRARNFARADQIREMLAERGIILEDTKEGTRWRRK